MASIGEPTKFLSDAVAGTPGNKIDAGCWLNSPFLTEHHNTPLGAGFLSLDGLSNLEVLARLVSLNGGTNISSFGTVKWDKRAVYNFRGLANCTEALLLNAMINFAAGMLAVDGHGTEPLIEAISAQIAIDGGQVVKH